MKHLLILFFVGLSVSAFAQKSDTLNIPVGKYQFIKVGDKLYKLVTNLEEVAPSIKSNLLNDGIWHLSGGGIQLTPGVLDTTFNTWQLLPATNITPYINKSYLLKQQ